MALIEKVIVRYYAFVLDVHNGLYLHPDFSPYGYDSEDEIINKLNNSKVFHAIFILKKFEKAWIPED